MKRPLVNRMQIIALLLCLLFQVRDGAAQFVEISAQIELTSYRSGQTNAEAGAKPRTISVTCIIGTNEWRIENDWSQNAVVKWFFDGTNVFETLQITKPPPLEVQETLKRSSGPVMAPFDTARSNLTINIWPATDGHPLGDEGVNLPWLAFCSGKYLAREGRLIPLPCEILRHTPDRYAYSDKTETFQDSLGLPRSIDLFLSKSLCLASVDDFYRSWMSPGISRYREHMKRALTNVSEGDLTFHYAVTSTTNFMGGTFPLRFEFFQKGRPFIQNGDWFKRGVGTLKSIRETAELQNVFDPSLQQSIVDWRFRDAASGADANTYQWTNSFTPDTEDPLLQEKFKKRVEQMRRRNETTK
jgi:hypothetical protein